MPQTSPSAHIVPPAHFNWDDLRFIISVAENGSAMAAAKKLGVNATTVQRRISKFEQQNAIRLFERRQSGLTPTPECEALMEASRGIEERISGIRREILGRDLRLEGRLSVTTTDTFMYREMARHLARFKELHPDIELEISFTPQRMNLSRQDADIAIRPSNNPPEHLVGQRVANLALAIYGVPKIIQKLNAGDLSMTNAPWVGLGSPLDGSLARAWMTDNIPAAQITMAIDTFAGVSIAAMAGTGLGILPCVTGDAAPGLQRYGSPIKELNIDIWVLTHPEIRTAAKIRAFMNFITKAMRGDSAILAGL